MPCISFTPTPLSRPFCNASELNVEDVLERLVSVLLTMFNVERVAMFLLDRYVHAALGCGGCDRPSSYLLLALNRINFT